MRSKKKKYKKTGKASFINREFPKVTTGAFKSWLIMEQGGCQLPSCSCSGGSINDYVQHHRDFWGKREDPLLAQRGVVDLLCKPEYHNCHDRVHKIAAAIIFFLEKDKSIRAEKLIWRVAKLLNERCVNVGFVLLKEFIPTGIVQMENWRCELTRIGGDRNTNIKKYIERQPEKLGFIAAKIQEAA